MPANVTLSRRQIFFAIAAVAFGGGLGTLLRDLVLRIQSQHWFETVVDSSPGSNRPLWWYQIPWLLLIINFVGVYVATRLLVGPLRAHDPNDRFRLFLITGLFGGLTSYSGLFVSLAALWHVSVTASLVVGFTALGSGILAGRVAIRRSHR